MEKVSQTDRQTDGWTDGRQTEVFLELLKSFKLIQHGSCWYFWGRFAKMYFGQRITCTS